MEEVHLTTIKPKNEVLLLAQEISFVKVLSCNDKRLRDRGIKRLKKWFMARSQGSADFTKDDHMRIWKGLFYCMWMSDKPLVQEELAEEISNLIHSFATFKASLLFVETFFSSLSIEWFGIDQLRLDKFMMLVRRFMRKSLELVERCNWPIEQVQQLADVYQKSLSIAPMGLSMHIIEVFCEELAKVGKGELSSDTILQFINVFARIMATLKDGRLISQITRCVFLHLIRQTELGIEHQEKFSAWKEYGFPGGDVDAAEKIEVDSDEEDMAEGSEEEDERFSDNEEEVREVGVDARAGKVDVLLPPLDFDPRELLVVLRELRNKKETTNKARKTLIQLITKFENLAAGKYPLGLHKVELPNKTDKKKEVIQAAKKLMIDEQKLLNEEEEVEEKEQLPVNKKLKKKREKLLKQKKSKWEVSESDENGNNSSFEMNNSWKVSESVEKNISSQKNTKKRKFDSTEENQGLNRLNAKNKKVKVSPFSVSESKENSFSTPVASTPKRTSKINVLKKTTANNLNISSGINRITPEKSSSNKPKKITQKSKTRNKKSENKSAQELQSSTNNIEIDQVSSNTSVGEKHTTSILNTSTTDKNNGWGGEWDETSGDVEYEIFIPNKKYVEKRKSLGLSYPVSSFVQKSAEKLTPVNRLKNNLKTPSSTPNSQKKVEFNLSANCSQDYKEYKQRVKISKSQVPFDASKKPVQGLLKNSTPSPINPFYKKKLNFLKSPS